MHSKLDSDIIMIIGIHWSNILKPELDSPSGMELRFQLAEITVHEKDAGQLSRGIHECAVEFHISFPSSMKLYETYVFPLCRNLNQFNSTVNIYHLKSFVITGRLRCNGAKESAALLLSSWREMESKIKLGLYKLCLTGKSSISLLIYNFTTTPSTFLSEI